MYWGAHVKNMDFYVQAKIHGETSEHCETDELTDFIRNLPTPEYRNHNLAGYYARKIAKAFKFHPDALWVTVDIIIQTGELYGHTELIEGAA